MLDSLRILEHTLWSGVQRVLNWFRDDIFRRLFFNAGKLLSAHGISAILGFALTALTARALGPENYGFLALVLTYEQTVGKLVSFNAWQAVVKFGSEQLQANDWLGLRQLIKFGFCLDVSSAIAGTFLAMALSGPVITLLGWNQALRSSLMLFSVLILFSLDGTPMGVLRLFDRFDLLSYASVFSVIVRLFGVGWCLITKQGLHGFVWVYLVTGIIGQLYRVLAALWVVRRQGVGNIFKQSLKGIHHTFPGIWDYVWTTNLNSTIRMLSREADELIIAGLTTPTALGLFKIAKQFSRILPMLTDPLYHSIYPELSRLWAAGKKRHFLSLIRRTTLIVGGIAVSGWVGFLLLGKWLITLTVGVEYLDAYLVAVIYMLALVIALCTFSFTPAMLAIGLPANSLKALVLATALYFGALIVFVNTIGIVGASLSYIVFYIIWSAMMLYYLRPYILSHAIAD